jgi:hypothetical protein
MPKFTTKTEYETVEKEYEIKKHYKNIDEINYFNKNGELFIELLEKEDLSYEPVRNIDEIVIFNPEEVSIRKDRAYGGALLKKKGGCVFIKDFRASGTGSWNERENILICSEELKTEINESKLNKLIDKITYP